MRFRPSAWKKRSRNSDKVNHQKADARVPAFFRGGEIRLFTESWWGANKGLGEAPKSCTRKEHESATDSIARRGQGAIAPCRVKGQRPLWGLGQRPNSSTGDQYAKRAQQRCRQRSVPASNFARPQTRPQAALPPSFREEPKKRDCAFFTQPRFLSLCNFQKRRARLIPPCPGRAPARCTARSMRRAWPSIRHESLLP